ncbi:MAG TPA: BTAD domain-containing putative transcriptional regulator [Pseudonocardiaceae bacterium]|nr:BTAD domain-containing putative transcriptional regulator [Pseudonocardiaceae bacterium]
MGPSEVRHDGVLVPIAAAKQRVLIAVLALAAGESVTVARLIECLWGDRPPPTARNTLQNYVLRLRRTLAIDAESAPLTSSSAGYRLDVDPDAVDVHRFRSLVRSARSNAAAGEPESAAALLDEALRLWHGEPLTDVPSEVLHREVLPGLVEQRLAALEQRIDLDLDRGRHRELITELVVLSTEHPLRERIWAQLILALYRSGRTAEALDSYRQANKILVEALGMDPGPELQRLHQAVLTNDPALTITSPAPEPVRERLSSARPVPRQLPAPSAHFVGRAREVRNLGEQLTAASASPLMVILAIGGTAGVGKTALAVHWAHLNAERFPDGQLYVNLRGFDPAGAPVPPMTAMRGFLIALGVSARDVPADPDEQIALYRSQLAGRRMLLVLDNARDAEQVRPLLPGAPGCLVLVTSRDQLTGLVALDGAVPLTLDLLTPDEARDLLVRRLGQVRVTREQAVVDELIEQCAGLPLALNIAAARAALHPNRPLADFVVELRDTHRRLDALTTGEATSDVRVVFSWSYRTLTPTTARVFRLLGLRPGPDISLLATAALAGHDPDQTRRALDELVRAHLIIEHAPDRYTQHDLLRAYAADQAVAEDSDAQRQAALRRVVDFYTHTACDAEHLLNPNRPPIQLDSPAPGVHPHQLSDSQTALAWLDAEYPGLLAAQQAAVAHAWHPAVWRLALAMNTVQLRRGHRNDRIAVWQAALDAGAHLPDPTARMHAHRRLGAVLADLGRHEEGIAHLHQSLALAEEHRDLDQQAETHRLLAGAWEEQRNDRVALEHATRGLDLRRALGQPAREAEARNQVGWHLAWLGEFDAARAQCETALAILRRHRDPAGEAATLDSLGYIDHHSGRHQQAIVHYQQALSLLADVGDILRTAETFENLGHPHAALGEFEQARAVWRKALDLYRQQRRDQAADRVQRQLDTLDQPGY